MKATYANAKSSRAGRVLGSNLTLMIGVALLLAGIIVAVSSTLGQRDVPVQATLIDNPPSVVASGAGTSTGYADRTIEAAQARIKQDSTDYKAFAQLGFAFQQKARETNDPTFYTQAEDALRKALAIKPDYYDALGGMGQLSLSRHDFSGALEWGKRAQALEPG